MMTQDEQRIAIAEWMGWNWKWWNESKTVRIWSSPEDNKRFFDNSLPNYPLDLNAMHEAEKKLTPEQHKVFREKLCVPCIGKGGPISAHSQQRSEALCRVIVPERFQ